ncbi:hypothetical protein [Alicyclobacillus shizuokensis]|uniref:hypothetical protein n=1 Tax=Alicyclobacillus shizuokensis TaxID=392014 RepID=UPI0008307686|nr:hypothetical protein [Alicyclobacillus shizuokensis]MCL6627022.1 hypothetical protein [Alicyclobacillus shizuokensis]
MKLFRFDLSFGAGRVHGRQFELAYSASISAGHAVYGEDGEWHETRTDTGLTAIVVEGEDLAPEQFIPRVSLRRHG